MSEILGFLRYLPNQNWLFQMCVIIFASAMVLMSKYLLLFVNSIVIADYLIWISEDLVVNQKFTDFNVKIEVI